MASLAYHFALVGIVVGGGYAATAILTPVLAAALVGLGLSRSEAVTLAALLGFVVYLVVLLWGFCDRRLLRVSAVLAVLAGGGLAAVHLLRALQFPAG